MADRLLPRARYEPALIAGLALVATALYVGVTYASGEPGFPLDDSWIHQTYARNLADTGRLAFVPGQTSAGSTAPLWTLALAIGYLAGLPYLLWTYALGWLCLAWAGWATLKLSRGLWPEQQGLALTAAAVLVTSWPLVWAAGSGMETLLFVALSAHIMATVIGWRQTGVRQPGRLGVLAGMLVLTRPEGLVLVALVVASMIMTTPVSPDRPVVVLRFGLAVALILLPYFAFNWLVGGALFPNTFYAKQAEYAFLWQRPLPLRFGQLLYYSLGGPADGIRGISGAHLLLAPGILVASWRSIRADLEARQLYQVLPLLWAAGLVLLYAWRLPVTYHHGRYLWPTLPVWVVYGLVGWRMLQAWIADRTGQQSQVLFLWRGVTGLTLVALLLLFLLLGLGVYREDVAFINGEMVTVAHWLQKNTPEESLIAAHDIGAIGYFARRPLLDLAGLISPEVVPLLDNEGSLAAFVLARKADYLVTAPGWPYSALSNSDSARVVFDTGFEWTRQQGFNNMAVYRLVDS